MGYSLAIDKVRFVGDPVAVVIARSLAEATSAANTVGLDIEPLPAVTEPREGARLDAPRIFDEVRGNTCFNYYYGEYDETVRAFDKAAHATRLRLLSRQVDGHRINPGGVVGCYDPMSDRVTLGPWSHSVRLIRSFAGEDALYSGHGGFVAASRLLGRPVKWIDDQPNSLLGSQYGCDYDFDAELALDKDGKFLAMRQVVFVNLGAHITNTAPLMAPMETSCALGTLYRMPLIEVRSRIVFTNTPPLGAHAGPFRPEPNYVMERLIDTAAREMKIDPFELRRRNLTRPEDESFTAALDTTCNSDFTSLLDKAAEVAVINAFGTRKAESARRGKLRGLGLGNYREVTASPEQKAALRVYREGVHVAEVEVNPDTGSFDVVKYAMVSTLGAVIRSDENSLMRSRDSTHNGALPALMNAIVDALGGKHVDAPATPYDVSQALNVPPVMMGLN